MACPDPAVFALARDRSLDAAALAALVEHTRGCATCARDLQRAELGPPTATTPTTPEPRPPPQVHDPLAGVSRLGRYHVLERIAEGGMGVVYSAYDPELDRRVAIKLTLAQVGDTETVTEGRARMQREAQALARLTHPNVTAVYDVGPWGDGIFFAMEYVDGETLSQWLATPRPWRDVLATFVAAGEGLAAAHRARLVHRDFKPSNVLMGKDGRVRVTDFGVARESGTAAPDAAGPGGSQLSAPLTQQGALLGTVGYMAPEQLKSEPCSAAGDQFSFCVALFQGLYGARPFRSESLVDFASDVLSRLPEPPQKSAVPAWLRRAVLKGLARLPQDRFPDMDALLAELRRSTLRRALPALLAGATLTVSALALGAVYEARTRPERVCGDAAAAALDAWSPARRARVVAAVSAASRPGANAADRVAARIDAYVARWSQSRRSACVAARLEHTQNTHALELRNECLDRRLDRVRATAELLEGADAALAEVAGVMAAQLPPLDDCADLPSLERRPPLPADAVLRARLATVDRAVARGWSLFAAGKADAVLAEGERFSPELEAIGYLPATADAHLLLGYAQRWQGDYQRSRTELERAVGLALRAGDDGLAGWAAAELGYTRYCQDAELQEIVTWGDLAQSLIDRAGAPEKAAAQVAMSRGTALAALKRPKDARPLLEGGVAGARRLGDDWLLAITLQSLAVADAAEGDFASGSRRITEALALHTAIGGERGRNTLQAIGEMGVMHEGLGELEEALAAYERAAQTEGKDAGTRAFELDAIATVLVKLRRLPEAWKARQQALALLESIEAPEAWLRVTVWGGYAESAYLSGDVERARQYAARAYDLCTPPVRAGSTNYCERADFLMARLLAGREPARAHQLAEQARASLAAQFLTFEAREIEAWLAQHPAR